ncbi:ribD domain-containing protein [Nocardia nova SH22a]|uniref:RibD domain-containing protein n=1 Tax=Nocardia nova SH22a TaxID=1415166 RepID=W5T719_9NOCA|nr:dihydrofolate reductase family protein [Nocardia nova]AHH15125.1 ribD domain-containing protein [Nocardia nova SH22a]
MRKLVYYVGVSLDGYIAGPAGEVEFYPRSDEMTEWMCGRHPDSIPTHIRPHVGMSVDLPAREWDTVLMGRGTYEPGALEGVTNPYAHLKQYVVSKTLDPARYPDVEIVADDPVALVRKLKQQEGKAIWLCGGGSLAGALIDEIDEMIIKSYPVLAGGGVSVVSGTFSPTAFRPVQRREFDNGAQVTWFERA